MVSATSAAPSIQQGMRLHSLSGIASMILRRLLCWRVVMDKRTSIPGQTATRTRAYHSLSARTVSCAWALPRGAAEVEVTVYEFPQAQVLGEGGRQEQAGIGHQAVIVEGDTDAVGVVASGSW